MPAVPGTLADYDKDSLDKCSGTDATIFRGLLIQADWLFNAEPA
jgi:hypothetical protein